MIDPSVWLTVWFPAGAEHHAVPCARAMEGRLRVPVQRLESVTEDGIGGMRRQPVFFVRLLGHRGTLADAATTVEREATRYLLAEDLQRGGAMVTEVRVTL